LLVALMVSLGLAVGAVVLAERVDTSFHTVDDLRAFSPVPVLVSIPRIVTRTDRRRRAWHMRLAASAAFMGLVVIIGLAYFAASGSTDRRRSPSSSIPPCPLTAFSSTSSRTWGSPRAGSRGRGGSSR